MRSSACLRLCSTTFWKLCVAFVRPCQLSLVVCVATCHSPTPMYLYVVVHSLVESRLRSYPQVAIVYFCTPMRAGMGDDIRPLFTPNTFAALVRAASSNDLSAVNPVTVQLTTSTPPRRLALLLADKATPPFFLHAILTRTKADAGKTEHLEIDSINDWKQVGFRRVSFFHTDGFQHGV